MVLKEPSALVLDRLLGVPASRIMSVIRAEDDGAGGEVSVIVAANQKSRNPFIELQLDGVKFSNFLDHNPVVLFNHDDGGMFGGSMMGGIPIGKASSIGLNKDKLIAAKFGWLEGDDGVARIKNAWDQRVLNSVSINFLPEKLMERGDGSLVALESDMLEFSVVTIPADPGAHRQNLTQVDPRLYFPVGIDLNGGSRSGDPLTAILDRLASIEVKLGIETEEGEGMTTRAVTDEQFATLEERVGNVEESMISLTDRMVKVEEELGMADSEGEDGEDGEDDSDEG